MARQLQRCPRCRHCWIEVVETPMSAPMASQDDVITESHRGRVFLRHRKDIVTDLRAGMSVADVGRKYDFNLRGFIAEGAREQYDDLREALGPTHVSLAISRSGHARRGLAARRRRRDG